MRSNYFPVLIVWLFVAVFIGGLIFLTVNDIRHQRKQQEDELKALNYNENPFTIDKVFTNSANTNVIVEYLDGRGIARMKLCSPSDSWSPKVGDKAKFRWCNLKEPMPILDRCE